MREIFHGIAGAIRAKDGETCWRRYSLLSLVGQWRDEAPWWQRRVYNHILQELWDLPQYPVLEVNVGDATEAEQNPLGQWQ